MDVDSFKQINDCSGHQFRDMILRVVAEEIQNAFPHGLTARLGGDEFVTAVLGPIGQKDLAERAKHLLEKITSKNYENKSAPVLSLSIGISQYYIAYYESIPCSLKLQ